MKDIPEEGLRDNEVLAQLETLKSNDLDWRNGRNFAYVYHPGDEISNLVKQAYLSFISENALNPTSFPSLKHMENSVLAMATSLFYGDNEIKGSMTTGGTESIMMTVFAARQYARNHKKIKGQVNIVVPASAHPAFHKAGHYFDVEVRVTPVTTDYIADPGLIEADIDENTVMLVASAPSYPHGVLDPIAEIAQLAHRRGLLCHVDACIGGFILPFLERSGVDLAPFDFRVEGVTSISADLHKYGYAAKGASVILYKTEALRKHQFYAYTEWNGGIYVSPTMTGTRPGGAIAGAYAALIHIGNQGYKQLSMSCYKTAKKIQDACDNIEGIEVVGDPCSSLFAIKSDDLDIYQVGDELSVLGWALDRQQLPPSLHLSINPAHEAVVDDFIIDLRKSVAKAKSLSLSKFSAGLQVNVVKGLKKVLSNGAFEKFQSYAGKVADGESKRSAALYGIIGELREDGELYDMVVDMLSRMFDHKATK